MRWRIHDTGCVWRTRHALPHAVIMIFCSDGNFFRREWSFVPRVSGGPEFKLGLSNLILLFYRYLPVCIGMVCTGIVVQTSRLPLLQENLIPVNDFEQNIIIFTLSRPTLVDVSNDR